MGKATEVLESITKSDPALHALVESSTEKEDENAGAAKASSSAERSRTLEKQGTLPGVSLTGHDKDLPKIDTLKAPEIKTIPATPIPPLNPQEIKTIPATPIETLKPQDIKTIPATPIDTLKPQDIKTIPATPLDTLKPQEIKTAPAKSIDATTTNEIQTKYTGPKYPDGTAWTGSNFNTDQNVSLSSVREGQTVEIDPFGHPLSNDFIRAAQDKGAKVVAYLPGGHCYTDGGPDGCEQFKDKAKMMTDKYGPVEFGKTGAFWETAGERRIVNQEHPGFVQREQERMLDVLRLGANGVRYDNLHSPTGGSSATKEQVKAIYDAFLRARDQFVSEGGKTPKGGFGLVPHNSMPLWEELINEGKVNPKDIFQLGLERTTQLANDADPLQHPEIAAAIRLAKKYDFGVAVTNFQLEHTLDANGRKIDKDLDSHHANYQSKVLQVLSDAGIKAQVTTVPDENNYYSYDSAGKMGATIKFSK